MTDPMVSIVIPCYKGEAYLAKSIESCMRQTYRNIEIIAVDDASPDNCAAIVEGYTDVDSRVKLIRHQHNKGVSEALNTGFASASGKFFARLAQDDLFREDAIAIMINVILSCPGVDLVYCDMQLIDSEGRFMHMLPSQDPERALLPCDRVGLCVLWSRQAWDVVGRFNPKFDASEDYEFILRLSRKFKLAKCLNEAPFFFRYHPTQGGIQLTLQQDYTSAKAKQFHFFALALSNPLRLLRWGKAIKSTFRVWKCKIDWMQSREYSKYKQRCAQRKASLTSSSLNPS